MGGYNLHGPLVDELFCYLSKRASLISATASMRTLVMVGAEMFEPIESSRIHRRKSERNGR